MGHVRYRLLFCSECYTYFRPSCHGGCPAPVACIRLATPNEAKRFQQIAALPAAYILSRCSRADFIAYELRDVEEPQVDKPKRTPPNVDPEERLRREIEREDAAYELRVRPLMTDCQIAAIYARFGGYGGDPTKPGTKSPIQQRGHTYAYQGSLVGNAAAMCAG